MDPFTGHHLGRPSFVRREGSQEPSHHAVPLEGTAVERGAARRPQGPSGGMQPTGPSSLSGLAAAPSTPPMRAGEIESTGVHEPVAPRSPRSSSSRPIAALEAAAIAPVWGHGDPVGSTSSSTSVTSGNVRPLTATEASLGASYSPEEPSPVADFTLSELKAALARKDEAIAVLRQELRGRTTSWEEQVGRISR